MIDVVQALLHTIPDDVHVGDEFPVHGTARVYGISDELIDASGVHDRLILPGERRITIAVTLTSTRA